MIRPQALLVVAGMLLPAAGLWAAEEEVVAKALRLSLTPDAPEVVLYEPLIAVVAIKNASPQPIEINVWITSTLQLFYARGDEAFAPYRPGWNAGKEIAGRRKLAPGEALAHDETFLLFSGGRKFLFSEPGRYRFKAQVSLGHQVIESEAASILVKPLPPDHIPASQLVAELGAARALQGWGLNEAGATMLEKLAADFPRSLYADHAHCALGRYYAGQHYSKRWGDVEAAKRAFARFSAVSARIGAMRTRAL